MNSEKESIIDYLKKPSGYMGIVILCATVIATYWVTSHFQANKELTIEESQYNFLTRNKIDESDVNQHIQVYYDGKEIYDPHVIKVTIKNSGNQEITADDFKNDKFEISFNKDVILYDASITNAVPSNIQNEIVLNLDSKNNRLLINPFLLNADESYTLSLITNQETNIYYNFRIAGISNTKKNANVYISKFTIILFGITVLLCIFLIIKMFNFKKRILNYPEDIISLITAIISIISVVVTLISTASDMSKNMQQYIFK